MDGTSRKSFAGRMENASSTIAQTIASLRRIIRSYDELLGNISRNISAPQLFTNISHLPEVCSVGFVGDVVSV